MLLRYLLASPLVTSTFFSFHVFVPSSFIIISGCPYQRADFMVGATVSEKVAGNSTPAIHVLAACSTHLPTHDVVAVTRNLVVHSMPSHHRAIHMHHAHPWSTFAKQQQQQQQQQQQEHRHSTPNLQGEPSHRLLLRAPFSSTHVSTRDLLSLSLPSM